MMKLFHYLHYGLAAILVLVGIKMILNHHFGTEIISTEISLVSVLVILAVSVFFSIKYPAKTSETV
jgi:tellurite resistance protein TerC